MSLLAELKRRNVFKVTTAYLALGWVVLEGSGTVGSVLRLPDWTSSFLFWLGLAGLPFVVVFAWVFELTPEGIKRDSEIDRSQSITHVTSKRLDYVIIALLVLAIGLFVLQYFRPPAAPAVVTSDATVTPTAPAAKAAAPVLSVPAPEPAVVAPNDKSIAVLPFVNMSSDKEQEYFSDGMSEELMNLLAKIPDLKVIARTSSFAFKGTNTPIAEIAKQLNVAHVLEGSVRKADNTVRITAQLIRAADSVHLWSETYDRPLNDVFAVQDEIAGAVVAQLKIKLLGAAPTAKVVNLEAYELLLRARELDRVGTSAAWEQAAELLDKAVAIDPQFALAWDWLADVHITLGFIAKGSRDESHRIARDATLKALALEPELSSAHAHLGFVAEEYDRDLAAAARHYTRALELEPFNVVSIFFAAEFATTLGRFDMALALWHRAIAQDPLYPWSQRGLSRTLRLAGRYDDAIASLRTAQDKAPGVEFRGMIAMNQLLNGEPESALAALENIPIETDADAAFQLFMQSAAFHSLGNSGESDLALTRLIQKFPDATFSIVSLHAWRGEADAAFSKLNELISTNEEFPLILRDLEHGHMFDNLHSDPRWLPLLRKIGKAPEQLAAIKFEVQLPQR